MLRANNIDLTTNGLCLDDIRYISDDIQPPESKRVTKGSLIICTASGSRSHLGKVALIDKDYDYFFGGFMGQVTPEPHIDSKFLFYVMTGQAYKDFIGSLSSGMNINNLKFDDLRSFSFAVPPLPEQKRIVAILDEAFEGIDTAIANTEKNLANARALFNSYLQSALSGRGKAWIERKLSDVCERITDGTHQTPTYSDKGIVFLSSRNVTSGKIDWEHIKYIDEKQHLEMHRRVAPKMNDILLAKNGTTGVAAIVDRDVVFDIYVSLALLRAKNEMDHRFLVFTHPPVDITRIA